ncbi:MAG: MBL fold metallo-hydrolase [Acinetobacter sp.]
MKIHHLNCGTMCPFCSKLMNGTGSWNEPGKLVCHCLLIEDGNRLMLVDTGLGINDIEYADHRIGKMFQATFKPKLDIKETAYHQIKTFGYSPNDVTDIFPTHLDLDHIGGLSDFPHATVHVRDSELQQILKPSLKDKFRFRFNQFSHKPKWKIYQHPDSQWFDLDAFSLEKSLGLNIFIIPLTGHTRGHVGIAIPKNNDQWLLHCGDAYYHHSQLETIENMPIGLKIFEASVQTLKNERIKSLNQLKALKKNHTEQIEFFCAHDPVELERYTN